MRGGFGFFLLAQSSEVQFDVKKAETILLLFVMRTIPGNYKKVALGSLL